MNPGAPPPAPQSSTVVELLLQESRQEVGRLRTENFQKARIAEERLQALQTAQRERDHANAQCAMLGAQLQQLEALLAASQLQIQELQAVQVQHMQLQEAHHKLQQELELSLRARRILQEELADERRQRKQAEEAKATLESERSRHQHAKDDLAMSLRVARKKAEEAEEEQLRAEEEAAQLRSELSALQAGRASVFGGGGQGVSNSADVAGGASSQAGTHSSGKRTSKALPPALPGSGEVALQEAQRAVEYERCRAEALLSRLTAAEEETAALSQEVETLEDVKAELHSTRRALHQLQEEQLKLQKDGIASPLIQQPQPRVIPPQQQQQQQQLHQQEEHPQKQQQEQQQQRQQDRPLNGPEASQPLPLHVQAEIDALRAKVAKLKGSRDKLLEQIDKQWEEVDRLGLEFKATSDELASTRRLAANWEAQAQDSLAQIDRLKEMLEEASTWGSTDQGQHSQADNNLQGTGSQAATSEAVLQEKARCAEMELNARALAAELLRAQHASMSMGKAMLPALSGLEYRLGSCLRTQT